MNSGLQLIATGKPFGFDQARDAEFERLVGRYPTVDSMILPALWLVQEQEGWVSQEAIAYVADRIGTWASKVYEAVTFYTMFRLQPPTTFHISVCRTLTCWLRGKEELIDYLREDLGLVPGKISADGRFSLEEVECLGHCGTAPVIQINDQFYEDMNLEKLQALLATLQEEAEQCR